MNKIAIMMRLTLNGEALNNEGSIGNILIPRQIELADGTTRQAISGDTLKHMYIRNLRLLAESNELCDGCKIFSPLKVGNPKKKNSNFSTAGNKSAECIIDDVGGHCDLETSKSTREGCAKFSFAIATEENGYQSMLHTRIDNVNGLEKKSKKQSKAKSNELEVDNNEDSMNEKESKNGLFYKPIRCNEYALTIQLDLDRISFDDERLVYVLEEDEIKARQNKALKALINMFLDVEGAMCSTRLPHLMNIEGVMVKKNNKNQILSKYSALNNDYKEINEKLSDDTVIFNNVVEFTNVMKNLIK